MSTRSTNKSQSYPSVGDNYLVRYSEHRRECWDPHTPASFDTIVNLLDEAAARGQPGELDEYEIMCGVNREPSGVLWDPYLRSLIKMPRAMFWDSMHCKWASGGVVQFMLNGIALQLCKYGVTLGALDVFTQQCKGHKLSKKFWSTRVVKGVRKHIRAFASEALDAMYILTLYCAEHEVASWPSMIQHVRALEVMNSIAMITSRPKDTLLNLETWEQCEAEYQQLQQALYATKPKCHLGRHCVVMSCWSPERDHHRSKLIAVRLR